jgi:hypothetical protein
MRLAAAGLLLAAVAWTPAADRSSVNLPSSNLLNISRQATVSPELPWFLKPANDPQKTRQQQMTTLQEVRSSVKFTENRGQITDQNGKRRNDVLYYGGVHNTQIYFTNNSIGYVFYAEAPAPLYKEGRRLTSDERPAPDKYVLEMEVLGANENVRVESSEQAPGVHNFMKGTPDQWITGVGSYEKLTYRNIYDRIDMVVESRSGGMKYDFVVHPGGDATQIRLKHKGAEKVSVTSEGKLRVETEYAMIEEDAPYSYQAAGEEVSNAYVVGEDGVVRFDVGSYDPSRTLTIDPTILWASFFGGTGNDILHDIEMRSDGSFVTVGQSSSTVIPTVGVGPRVVINGGGEDAIVAAFNSSCALTWYTYVGGSQEDIGSSIELDGNYVYIMGTAISTPAQGFPAAGTVPQAAKGNASRDQFVAALDAATGALIWVSYRGGTGIDFGNRISVRSFPVAGGGTVRIVVGGGSSTGGFPTTAGALQTTYPGGAKSGTLFRWIETKNGAGVPTGATENWSTYIGGEAADEVYAVEQDADKDVFVGGSTESLGPSQSGSFPAAGGAGVITTHTVASGSQFDGFSGKFDSTGARLCLGFFGGTGNDNVFDGGFDNNNLSFWLTGRTISDDFSGTSSLPFACGQSSRASSDAADAFLARFSNTCVLECATYHGGTLEDSGEDLDVVENSMARQGQTTVLVCGITQSMNMPISPTDNQQGSQATPLTGGATHKDGGCVTPRINNDWWIACFSEVCCRLWSTYYGGDEDDQALGISAEVVNGKDRVVVCGVTTSDAATDCDNNGSDETASDQWPAVFSAGAFNQGTMTPTGIPDGAILKFEFRVDEKLPIDLASFGASVNGQRVTLDWRTASEDHNAGFEIHRAELLDPHDQVVFKPIASYLKNSELTGLGNSPIGKPYRFIDDGSDGSLKPGRIYLYHLVDIATDGSRTTHPSILVRLNAGAVTPVYDFRVDPVTPNPVTDAFTLSFSLREADMVTVDIYGADGKKVGTPILNESFGAGDNGRVITVSNLAPGVYTAVVSTGDFSRVRTRQFVVVR